MDLHVWLGRVDFHLWTAFGGWIFLTGGAEWPEETWLGDLLLGLLQGIGSGPAGAIAACVAMGWLFCVLIPVVIRNG